MGADCGDLSWRVVETRQLMKDDWLDLREVRYRMADGRENPWPYYTLSRGSFVVIAAVDAEGNYLCVRQFRPGIGEVTTEMPAGGIESDSRRPSEVEALAAARRELLEETGCEAESWTHLLTIPTWATISDDYAHVYLAEGCRKVADLRLDETEELRVERLSPSEVHALIEAGQFQQVVHVAAYFLAEERLRRA